jgi:hypothetical protein
MQANCWKIFVVLAALAEASMASGACTHRHTPGVHKIRIEIHVFATGFSNGESRACGGMCDRTRPCVWMRAVALCTDTIAGA